MSTIFVKKQLSERRAGDRATMAQALVALAARLELSCERTDHQDQRVTMVRLESKSGLSVMIDLDGKSQTPDSFLLSWVQSSRTPLQLNDCTFGGNVNPFHRQKATYLAAGFDELLQLLERGFTMANNGSAYRS